MFQLIPWIISLFYAKHDCNFVGKKLKQNKNYCGPADMVYVVVSSPLGSYWGREIESWNILCKM
jgi:hypothetical protein